MKPEIGRFWLRDDFVDSQARNVSVYAQAVYMALCRHANAGGETFVGVRRLGEELGINKDTAGKAIRELVASGLVGHCRTGRHRVSGLRVASVRNDGPQRPAASDRRNALRNSKEPVDERDPVRLETLDRLKARFVRGRFVA